MKMMLMLMVMMTMMVTMTMMVMVMMTMIMSDFVWLILSSGHSSHFAIGVLLDKAFPDYPSYCICRFFIVPENICKPSYVYV